MHTYHCHIYFVASEAALAEQVRTEIVAALPSLTYAGHLINYPIGPHPQPMFEIHIPAANLEHALNVIEEKRRGLSALIHPVQADELAAHTELAKWLGTPLELRLEYLPR